MRSRNTAATVRSLSVFVGLALARPLWASELARQLSGEGPRSLRQMALEAARAVGEPPVVYWAIGLTLFSVLTIASLMPLFVTVERGRTRRPAIVRLLLDRRFFGWMVGLSIFALRWPIFARTLLNTDESHAIACAMKLWVDPLFWRGIDGTTGGPLLYYPLMLPRLIGLPIEYASARVIGVLALIGSVLLAYGIVRRLFSEGVARLAVLPLVASWALTTSSHFAHYSSEQIPVFLTTLALYLLVRWWKDAPGSDRTLVLSGVVLGCVPFAKLQAVPMGIFLALCGAALVVNRYRSAPAELGKRLLAFVASGFAVPFLFLILMVSGGAWDDFWQSYIVNNLGYGGRYLQLGEVAVPLSQKLGVVLDRMFWTFDLSELVGGTMAFSLAVVIGAVIWGRRLLIEVSGRLLFAIGWLVVSAVAVALPNTLFTHYFLFLAVPVTLFGSVWLGLAVGLVHDRSPANRQTVAMAILVMLFLTLTVVRPFHHRMGRSHPVFTQVASIAEVEGDPVASVVLGFARVGEPMAVWGWQPWRYVETGLVPATRDTQTQWQILDTPQRPYYLDRFRKDLLSSLPPVFVDTVGYVEDERAPWRPVFWDRKTQAHDVFTDIGDVVDSHYQQVAEIGASRIYVSRARLAEMESSTALELGNLRTEELLDRVPDLARVELP